MKKHTLAAKSRTLLGNKVKQLRAQGQVPATVYGKKVKSASVVVPLEAFEKVYAQAGETGLVELSVDGTVRPVLIHNVQKNPVHGSILHVEFYQVDLKEKVHANVPLETAGEAPAVTGKLGVLLSVLDEIEVEALPTDLPEKIIVDVSGLAEVNQEIKVSDLKIPAGVTVLSDEMLTVVKVGPLVTKAAEAQAAEEAAAAAEAQTEAPAAEGEAAPAAEDAQKAASAKAETPKEKAE